MSTSGSSSSSSGAGPSDAGQQDTGSAQEDASDSATTVAWSCPPGPFGNPIPAGAVLSRVPGVPPPDPEGGIDQMGFGFSTIEGPVWIGSALLMSEYPGNPNPPPSRILQVTASGVVSVAGPAGWNPGSNGLAVDSTGALFGAIHGSGSISKLDVATGTSTVVAASYPADGGKRFNSPNDLTIRSDGTIYFSDPNYQAPSPQPQSVTGLYRVAAGSHQVSLEDGTLNQPNGVTLSIDESTLYVSSKTMNGSITKYPVHADGSLGTGTTFVQTLALDGGSIPADIDGMAIDCAGNLYGAVITSGSGAEVVVISPSGSAIASLPLPNVFSATNVAFGGADHRTLYVTAQGSGGGMQPPGQQAQGLYQVQLNVPGMPY